MRLLCLALGGFSILAQQPAPTPGTAETVPAALYVPERVYDTNAATFSDFEVMVAELARADVVFVGEAHGDPNTHRLEAALLQGLDRRHVNAAVSLEMFERDVQHLVDAYLSGSLPEEDFLSAARPWPRYRTDYRPLVEIARTNGWPVIAANVPRRYAAAVAKTGLAVLETLTSEERALIAEDVVCPLDAYFDRFVESMNSHPMSDAATPSGEERRATNERYYMAQCIKDETMAESIAREVERTDRKPGPVVHYNGSFHSDFGAGAAERVRRRLPARRVVVVSMIPVKDIDTAAPGEDESKRADYLVYTVK